MKIFRSDEASEPVGALHLLRIILVVADELWARPLPFFELLQELHDEAAARILLLYVTFATSRSN